MTAILKVDTIQDTAGNNIINESSNTITIGASGDTISIPSGATITNSGTANNFGGGKVLQVVQAQTTTAVTSTATGYTDSGLSGSITPSATSSKILILITQPYALQRTSADNWLGQVRLLRASTAIWTPATYSLGFGVDGASVTGFTENYLSINYLDSPSSTSSVTYKTQFGLDSNGQVVTQRSSSPSQIILMEIGA
jgi:hypothetical protein